MQPERIGDRPAVSSIGWPTIYIANARSPELTAAPRKYTVDHATLTSVVITHQGADMIIELGKASVATKAVMPNGLVLDPTPLVAPKIYQQGRTL